MMDTRTLQLLRGLVEQERRSVLQYVHDAYPWTTAAEDGADDKLRRLVEEDRDAVAELARFLARHRYPVTGGASYPASFTTLNFLALDHLLTPLLASVEQSIRAVEATLGQVTDADARTLLEKTLAFKRRQRTEIERLKAAAPAPLAG